MALWRYVDNIEMERTSFHKKRVSADAYICCPGPSLNLINPEDLKKPGVTTFGINRSYPYIKPDVWFGMDFPQCYPREVFWESFVKIMRGGMQGFSCEGHHLSVCPNLYFADCKETDNVGLVFEFDSDDMIFAWTNNVMLIALNIVLWMGYKRIHFLGCDFSTEEGDYHDGIKELSDENRRRNNILYDQLNNFLKYFSEQGNERGVKVFSCTPDSRINEYLPYVPLKTATQSTQDEHSIPSGGKLFHSKDLKGVIF